MPTLIIDDVPTIDIITYSVSTPRANIIRHEFSGLTPTYEVGGYSEGNLRVKGYIIDSSFFTGITASSFNRIFTAVLVEDKYVYVFRDSFIAYIRENISYIQENRSRLDYRTEIECDLLYSSHTMGKKEVLPKPQKRSACKNKAALVNRNIIICKR